jgi:hypothetical protein
MGKIIVEIKLLGFHTPQGVLSPDFEPGGA